MNFIVKYVESGDRINTSTAVLILLSISFGVGYLFLPLSFFVQQTLVCKIERILTPAV
jgi:hypothetical protein